MHHFLNHYAPAAGDTGAAAAGTGTGTAGTGTQAASESLDFDWVLVTSFMLLLMQLGLALIISGSVRYKNSQSVVIKILLNLTLGVFVWWLLGYAIAFGVDKGQFLGWSYFAGNSFQASDYARFFERTGFALFAISIVVGGTVERLKICSWCIPLIIFLVWIYPICAHWSFGQGWLSKLGFHDFAGASTVNIVAGTCALIATIILKPRNGRYDPTLSSKFVRYNELYVAFGTLILFATYIFLISGVEIHGEDKALLQSKVAVFTVLAGATGGLIAYALEEGLSATHSLFAFSRGLIAGVVAVSGGVDQTNFWFALLYGLLGGLVYKIVSKQLEKLKIDDPVDVIGVHFGAGLIGTFLTGLVDLKGGLFVVSSGKLLGAQLVGIVVHIAWPALFIALPLLILKGLGQLRVSQQTEVDGLDRAECGGENVNYRQPKVEQLVESTTKQGKLVQSIYK